MTDCRLCPAGTVALRLSVSGGGRRGGPRSRTGIQRASDAARRSLVFKNGVSCNDSPVCVLGAVVGLGHPGSSGISGDDTGSLVHGTGVPILFPFQQTPEPARSGGLIGLGKAFIQGHFMPVGRQRASSRPSRYLVAEPLGKRLRVGPWQNARPGSTSRPSGRTSRRAGPRWTIPVVVTCNGVIRSYSGA
jgi:hypothetical protein